MTESTNKNLGSSFADIFNKFGSALSEIFNDPELKAKAQEFGKNTECSANAFIDRLKDEEVKAKWREVGKAAQDFGRNVADEFKTEKSPESNKTEAES